MVSVPSTPGDPDLLMSIVLPYFLGLCFLVQTASQFLRSKNRLHWASLVAQTVKNLPAIWETWVRSLGWKDPLEKGMATHSSILAWRIQWTQEPGGLQSMGSQRVRHDWATKHITDCIIWPNERTVSEDRHRDCCVMIWWKSLLGSNGSGFYFTILFPLWQGSSQSGADQDNVGQEVAGTGRWYLVNCAKLGGWGWCILSRKSSAWQWPESHRWTRRGKKPKGW